MIPPKAAAHLIAHPEVKLVLPEAIRKTTLPENGFLSAEVEMGRIVGKESKVSTPRCDLDTPIVFAQRLGRYMPSRVAPEGVAGENTTKVVVLAFPNRSADKSYILVTSWVGGLACKEPWDPMIATQAEYRECLKFWCSNALVHDPAVMGHRFESTWRNVLENSSVYRVWNDMEIGEPIMA